VATRRFSTASIKTGSKSNKMWDQDTQQGALVPIASLTANGTANGFLFENVPQGYQDLRIVMFYRSTDLTTNGVNLYVNTGTPTDRGITGLQTNGSSATSFQAANVIGWYNYNPNSSTSLPSTNNVFVSSTWDIFNYASTSVFKTGLVRTAFDSNGAGATSLIANCVRNTAAITRLQFYVAFGNIVAGSTVTLYGIKAGV